GPRQALVEDVIADEHAHLVGTLAHLEAEMHVEQVQQSFVHDEVETNATPRLTARPPGGEGGTAMNGQAGRHRGGVRQAVALWRGPQGELHLEPLGEGLGLWAQHLLDAHEVGVDLLEHVGDALEIHAPIETGAAMDVVARNREVHTKTLRSSSTTV